MADMHVEVGLKLRLTAVALRCGSRKELCARFRTVNPATHCDLERLHKWMQGRSVPRSPQVFDDWARLLGTRHSATWIATCQVEPFLQELAALAGIPAEDLRRIEPLRRRPAAAREPPGAFAGARALDGAFACYSPAWSPHFRGRMVRSSLTIGPGQHAALRATYRETIAGRRVQMAGEALLAGQVLHTVVTEPGGHLPMSFSLHVPGAPASVLCGVISGFAFLSPEPLPSASRLLAVRVPSAAALHASNRYLEWAPAMLSDDLRSLGVGFEAAAGIDRLAAGFFAGRLDQVAVAEQMAFCRMFDPALLAGSDAALGDQPVRGWAPAA